MNTFKTLNYESALHIGEFIVEGKKYEIYFLQINDIRTTNILLPEDVTPMNSSIYEVAFDSYENQRNHTHYARENIGHSAIKVFRRVIDLIFEHYEEHQPGFYCFRAEDEKLEVFYQSILSILIRKHPGFIVQRAAGDKDYVIRTPFSL